MRVFRDPTGTEWDVFVGRESWGTVLALFVRRTGPGSPRQALLEVSSADEGSRLLRELSEEQVSALFRQSVPKPED